MAKRHYIIPIFVPHRGCPQDCVFCNQAAITGQSQTVSGPMVGERIEEYLRTIPRAGEGKVEVAFYGRSFIGIPRVEQCELLEPAARALAAGRIDGIRLSTRPDNIDRGILAHLRRYQVSTIEIGVQSLDPAVLTLSRRGHDAESVRAALALIREYGFSLGVQLMAGLPGDDPDKFAATVRQVIDLSPDFVRIYPTMVLRGTVLERMYRAGTYLPLSLEEALTLCREALMAFTKAGMPVIRIGLQPSEEIAGDNEVVAGPLHPAFRQLVEGQLMRIVLSRIIESETGFSSYTFRVSPHDESAVRGQKNANLVYLRERYALDSLRVESDPSMPAGKLVLQGVEALRLDREYRVSDLL